MRRRAFLQLLGLAGVAASVDASGLIRLDPSGKVTAFDVAPDTQAELLDAIETGAWCRYGSVDLSPWLLGLTVTHGTIDVTTFNDPISRFIVDPLPAIELDLVLPDQDTRAALHEIHLGHAHAVLEFGDGGTFSYSVSAYLREIWADETARLGMRLAPTGMVSPEPVGGRTL